MTHVAVEAHVEADVNMCTHNIPLPQISAQPPGIGAGACSCALESHLRWRFATSWPDFVLFTKETPMVTGITQQPQNSWKLLVNQSHTGLAEDGKRGTKSKIPCFGYSVKIHIRYEALSILVQ